ncbi:hypothetical protein HNR19_001159 [Nocardioides thalensis]|uniref:Peptidoglycan recognition protein family domain-containing protein n=1 Tax=Nocardioides thalensis TaxID=1914755 RepID=A0A853BZS8_9ACTN|nr:N-acetylmuramoyl-L-alanine amidase [Nocardioides thalensis]NYJ00461.1 hypothetical protein [Nocardioides thalensis]
MSISDSLLPPALSRRRLARLIAGAVAVPAVAAAVPPAPAGATPPGSGGRVRLRRDAGSVVSAAELPLAEHAGVTRSAGTVRTAVIETTGFSMLGVTWASGTGHVRVRVRRAAGGWSDWESVARMHDGPDTGSAEGRRARGGTEPMWVGRAEALQVEVTGWAQQPVLMLIDPGRRAEDAVAVPEAERDDTVARTATGDRDRTPKPRLLTRRAWGANPKLRDGTQVVNRDLEQVHLHHTVNSNSYARSDVPGLIRGMYRYHTKGLGWSDLGYNFLVDRFGRIWIGRKDSGRKLVKGAHTLGFNHRSMGVAVIGNFEVKRPNDKIVRAIVQLAAWRVDAYDLRPRDTIKRKSQGSDNYAPGETVWLPVIDGHRDTNDTACPGKHLYAELPRIRRWVHTRIRRFNEG